MQFSTPLAPAIAGPGAGPATEETAAGSAAELGTGTAEGGRPSTLDHLSAAARLLNLV